MGKCRPGPQVVARGLRGHHQGRFEFLPRGPGSALWRRGGARALGLALVRTRSVSSPGVGEGEGSHVATRLQRSRTWVKTERFGSHEDRLAFPVVALL